MLNPTVPDAMAEAFTGTGGDFLDRLLAALDAAQAEGGDIRGQQAAALVVSSPDPGCRTQVLRLQVEDHDRPLAELRRLVDAAPRVQRALDRADGCAERRLRRRPSRGRARLRARARRTPRSRFWHAGMLTLFGDPAGRPELDAFLAAHPDWREFIRRLVAAGVVPDSPEIQEHHRRPKTH